MKRIRNRRAGQCMAAVLFAVAFCGPFGQAMSQGRPLPKPETARPALDDSLPPYVPCEQIKGQRDGSAPAILPDLVNRWRRAFGEKQAAATFVVPPPYAGPQGRLSSTLREFLDGDRDFAFLTRELLASDRESFRRAHAGKDPIAIPVAMGSYRHFGFVDTMVLVVHQDNPIGGLTFKQLDSIYSSQRFRGGAPARTWGDLGLTQTQWKDRPIVALGGGRRGAEDSAKAAAIRERVLGVAGREAEWNDRLPAMGDGEDNIPTWIAKSPGAIGISALGQMAPGVKAIPISEANAGPWLAPTQETVYSGQYPLLRSIDLLVAPAADGGIDPMLAEWLRYLLSRDGQAIVLDQGVFLPLRGRLLDSARQQLRRVGADTCQVTSSEWISRSPADRPGAQ